MKVEVVEFYPLTPKKDSDFLGTMHFYLEDLDVDLRGCPVFLRCKKFKIFLPSKIIWSPENNSRIVFPVFSFSNSQTKKRLVQEMARVGSAYILQLAREEKYTIPEIKQEAHKELP